MRANKLKLTFLLKSGVHPQGCYHHFVQTWTCLYVNFGLAVGCIPHWLPSLDKICKHPIFSGSERYPTGLIYTHLGCIKRIWYLSPMRAAKVQASLRIRAVSPEPPLLAHTSSEARGTFRQKARSLAPLNGWACAVKICHDGMLEDTNSLDAPHLYSSSKSLSRAYKTFLNGQFGNIS